MNRASHLSLSVALLSCALAASPEARASDKGVLDDILGNWLIAQGGLGSSVLVQNYEIQESVESDGKDHPVMELHIVRTRADHFRFEMSRPGSGTAVQAFDGRLGWQAQAQWGLGLTGNPASGVWVWQNDLLLALKTFRPPVTYRLLSPAIINGRSCIAAEVTDSAKNVGKVFFDRKTHQLLRLERPFAVGSTSLFAAEFDDFRRVNGLVIPFLVKAYVGKSAMIHRRSKITINPPVDETTFVLTTAQMQEAMNVNDVLNHHDASAGGGEALARIHTRVTRLSLEVLTTGTRTAETISQKLPNLILEELETPGMGREARGYDGTTGWVSSELQGYRPLKPAELAQLITDGSIHLVGRLGASFPFRKQVGERVVNGRPAVALALATMQGPAGTFYFDKGNGRLLRVGSPIVGDRTNSTESTVDFSDFRSVDGVEIPFVLIQTSPLIRAVSTIQSVENNAPLSDKIFRPRREE
jgi:hypothetical protein